MKDFPWSSLKQSMKCGWKKRLFEKTVYTAKGGQETTAKENCLSTSTRRNLGKEVQAYTQETRS